MDLTTRLFLQKPPRAAFRALLRVRDLLGRAQRRMLPANAQPIIDTLAIAHVRGLGVAAELDLAGYLHRSPMDAGSLAAAAGADPDATERLLHLLAAGGYFRQDRQGRWRNTRQSSTLRSDHPMSVRDWARFFGGGPHFRFWADAEHSIRTGESAVAAVTGQEFFEWAAEVDPDTGERFDAAQRDGSRLVGLSIRREVDLAGVRTICDVGGGTGRLLAQLLENDPGRRGILFDLPEVVARSAPLLAEAGVSDRVEVVGGSFFESVPAGADRYVLVSVVHDWDDERVVEILRACADAAVGDARILVVEQVIDPTEAPFIGRQADLLMLVLSGGGRERTDDQFRALFADAGLEVTRTFRLATPQQVYELAPATDRSR
ncbi:MAG: methyltransferase [Actinomycetota bacterium]